MPGREGVGLIVDEDNSLDQAANEKDTEGISGLPSYSRGPTF